MDANYWYALIAIAIILIIIYKKESFNNANMPILLQQHGAYTKEEKAAIKALNATAEKL